MATLNIALHQDVKIPELLMSNGKSFSGRVESNEAESLVVRFDPKLQARKESRNSNELYIMTWTSNSRNQSSPVLVRKIAKGELVCQVVIEERRRSIRVHCDLSLVVQIIEPDALAETVEELMSRVGPEGEPESVVERLLRPEIQDDALRVELNTIRELIDHLSSQVDHLTRVVEGDSAPVNEGEIEVNEVLDCSATGLAFRHETAFEVGSFFKAHLEFHQTPKVTVDCIGVIVRTESRSDQARHTDQFDHGLRFTHIHEEDRERIVRQVFKVQRSLLRDRKVAT